MDIFHTFTSKAFSAMSKKEVKTPLSFFFRVVLAVLLIVLLAMFMMEPNQRMEIFLIGIAVLILLFVGVFTFAWLNPKNLVYGEGSHRAEMKLGFGTETKELTAMRLPLFLAHKILKSFLLVQCEAKYATGYVLTA